MTLAFEPQQIFQVLAALSVYICKVTGCMCILRLYVFKLSISCTAGYVSKPEEFQRLCQNSYKSSESELTIHVSTSLLS